MLDNVGWQLKKYRKSKGLTLSELSKSVNLSISLLSNIERGLRSPTIVTLQKICKALDITINELLDDAESKQVVRKSERKPVFSEEHDNSNVSYFALSQGTHRLNGMCMVVNDSGTLHESFEHKVDEFGVIIEGEMDFWLAGTLYHVEEGDSIYVPAGTTHSFRNTGSSPCVSYWVTASEI